MRHFIFLLLGLTILSTTANAQAVCGKRADFVARLESGHQEFNSAMGMSGSGNLVELYTSEKGTWTLMITQPNGVSCLMAAGENWESFKPLKPEPDAY